MTNPEILKNDNTPLAIGLESTREKTVEMNASLLVRGTVLGALTANDKLKPTESGAVDGSEIPKYIALQDIDASVADVDTDVAAVGRFNQDALVFVKGGDTIETVESGQTFFDHLRNYGILAIDLQDLDQFDNE